MCIIMSLNVNEMELKDPAQRTWLAAQNERKKKKKEKEKCQGYRH